MGIEGLTKKRRKNEEEKKRRKVEEKEEEGMEVDDRGLKRKPEEQLMPDGDERMVAQLVGEIRERYFIKMHEFRNEHPECEEPVLEILWEVFVDDISGEVLDPERVRRESKKLGSWRAWGFGNLCLDRRTRK